MRVRKFGFACKFIRSPTGTELMHPTGLDLSSRARRRATGSPDLRLAFLRRDQAVRAKRYLISYALSWSAQRYWRVSWYSSGPLTGGIVLLMSTSIPSGAP